MKQTINLTITLILRIIVLVILDYFNSLFEDLMEVIMNNLFPFSGTWRSKKLQRHQMVLVKRILLLFAGPCKTNIFSLLLTL
jgi:hypothetical protein